MSSYILGLIVGVACVFVAINLVIVIYQLIVLIAFDRHED